MLRNNEPQISLDEQLKYSCMAMKPNAQEIGNLLVKGASPVAIDQYHRNALHYACSNPNLTPEILQLLLNKVRLRFEALNQQDIQHGDTPLHLACKNYLAKEIVEMLLNYNASLNIVNKKNEMPLHALLSGGDPSQKSANFKSILKLLISKGADVNAPGNDKDTPLAIMIKNEPLHTYIPYLLKNKKLNIDEMLPCFLGSATALYRACANDLNPWLILQFLERGADPHLAIINIHYQMYGLPIEIASRHNQQMTVFFLSAYGATLKNWSLVYSCFFKRPEDEVVIQRQLGELMQFYPDPKAFQAELLQIIRDIEKIPTALGMAPDNLIANMSNTLLSLKEHTKNTGQKLPKPIQYLIFNEMIDKGYHSKDKQEEKVIRYINRRLESLIEEKEEQRRQSLPRPNSN